MKRTLIFGLATLALGFMVHGDLQNEAQAQEVTARDADGQRPATLHEINAFLSDLSDLQQELGAVQSAVATDSPLKAGANADWRWDECRFQSVNRPLWTANEERLTATCATQKWSVPGGLSEFIAIGQCESGWSRFAYNPGGPYLGIFQHAASAYVSRVHDYGPTAWDHPLSTEWRNSRGQIVMTARYMHANGTGAWSCA